MRRRRWRLRWIRSLNVWHPSKPGGMVWLARASLQGFNVYYVLPFHVDHTDIQILFFHLGVSHLPIDHDHDYLKRHYY